MLISDFIDELSRRLRDTNKRQWDQDFLVDATNAAFTCMCNAIPSSHTIELDVLLKDGTRQELPEQIHRVIDFLYNVTPSGQPSKPVTNVDRGALDTGAPDWRTDPPRDHIRHWVPSGLEESTFDVWPQARQGMSIHGVFTKVPVVNVDAENPDITVPEVIVPPKPVKPNTALYKVEGLGTTPSDGNVALKFIDFDPVAVLDSGFPVRANTILDITIPIEMTQGNILTGSSLTFDRYINSHAEDDRVSDNDEYVRIFHQDPMAAGGNYILDTNTAPTQNLVEGSVIPTAEFLFLSGDKDGDRVDFIVEGSGAAWLVGSFIDDAVGQKVSTASIRRKGIGIHAYWVETSNAWLISDGKERRVS